MPYLSDLAILEQKVIGWADAKGIFLKGTPEGQVSKTQEEVTELEQAIKDNDYLGIKDGIGDSVVTLIIQAKMQGMTLHECLEYAYGEIANRTGTMKDGVFVKNE